MDIRRGTSESLRWRDHQATVEVMMNTNYGGKVLKLDMLPASSQGRSTWICVPVVANGSVWRRLYNALVEVLDGRNRFNIGRGMSDWELVVGIAPPIPLVRTFSDMVRRTKMLERSHGANVEEGSTL